MSVDLDTVGLPCVHDSTESIFHPSSCCSLALLLVEFGLVDTEGTYLSMLSKRLLDAGPLSSISRATLFFFSLLIALRLEHDQM